MAKCSICGKPGTVRNMVKHPKGLLAHISCAPIEAVRILRPHPLASVLVWIEQILYQTSSPELCKGMNKLHKKPKMVEKFFIDKDDLKTAKALVLYGAKVFEYKGKARRSC